MYNNNYLHTINVEILAVHFNLAIEHKIAKLKTTDILAHTHIIDYETNSPNFLHTTVILVWLPEF